MSVEAIQEFFNAAFESQLSNIYTSMPCVVVNVRDGGNTQMVDIQPTINVKMQDGTVAERPTILGVPVEFPVSSKGGMTHGLEPGDTGIAHFSMRSLDAWKSGNGRASAPLNAGRFDKSDAMFVPGLQPMGSAVNNPAKHVHTHDPKDTVLFANLGGQEAEVRLKVDGSVEISTVNSPVTINCSEATVNATTSINLNSPSMTVDVANTTWIGNINQTGTYVLDTININLHKHIGVTTGSGTSGPGIN